MEIISICHRPLLNFILMSRSDKSHIRGSASPGKRSAATGYLNTAAFLLVLGNSEAGSLRAWQPYPDFNHGHGKGTVQESYLNAINVDTTPFSLL